MLLQVSGRGIPKAHKMDITLVDSSDFVLKKLATIKREPEEDNFQVKQAFLKLHLLYVDNRKSEIFNEVEKIAF